MQWCNSVFSFVCCILIYFFWLPVSTRASTDLSTTPPRSSFCMVTVCCSQPTILYMKWGLHFPLWITLPWILYLILFTALGSQSLAEIPQHPFLSSLSKLTWYHQWTCFLIPLHFFSQLIQKYLKQLCLRNRLGFYNSQIPSVTFHHSKTHHFPLPAISCLFFHRYRDLAPYPMAAYAL